jgi:hypothetical protein
MLFLEGFSGGIAGEDRNKGKHGGIKFQLFFLLMVRGFDKFGVMLSEFFK